MVEKIPKCTGPSGCREVRFLQQWLLSLGRGRVKRSLNSRLTYWQSVKVTLASFMYIERTVVFFTHSLFLFVFCGDNWFFFPLRIPTAGDNLLSHRFSYFQTKPSSARRHFTADTDAYCSKLCYKKFIILSRAGLLNWLFWNFLALQYVGQYVR